MKKVLILSYFFPPANFAGSYRIASWAKYLNKFGYYPVIVTRNWNPNQYEISDKVIDNVLKHEKLDGYEVYCLPYNQSLRDRLHAKYGDRRFRLFRKFLSLTELVFQNWFNFAIPYSNIYRFSLDLARKDKNIVCIIASGKPYQLFKFAGQISAQTLIPWIADYRDEWTTHQWLNTGSLIHRFINRLERNSELRWLSNAAGFVSVTRDCTERIACLIGKKGAVVLNGYESEYVRKTSAKNDKFTIVYNGTLYPAQPVEVFLIAFKRFIDQNPKAGIRIEFPGVIIDKLCPARIQLAMKGYESYYGMTARIPKTELAEMLNRADLFLMVGIPGAKGTLSTKVFDYVSFGKPILLAPSDDNVMEAFVKETGGGFICRTEDECLELLKKAYLCWERGESLPYQPVQDKIAFYSRENQAEVLAGILTEFLTSQHAS